MLSRTEEHYPKGPHSPSAQAPQPPLVREASLSFRRLTTQAEIEKFCATSKEQSGANIPLEYLCNQGVVYAAYQNSEMVGGWALVNKSPIRILEILPQNALFYDEVQKELQSENIVELNALWLKREIGKLA